MFIKWLPWRFIVKRVARAHGFIDPISVLSYLHRFSQPAEVTEPLELLRAGVVFHARGLMNTRAIQHNLDWIWPYWVERQFDPTDPSFIPRAFSITHVNLTHRNWTALGIAESTEYPIVDPRGLVTPHYDGWSLDFWIMKENGQHLFPSKIKAGVHQSLSLGDLIIGQPLFDVKTLIKHGDAEIELSARVENTSIGNEVVVSVNALNSFDAALAVCIRPYNPEGVSFISSIKIDENDNQVALINKDHLIKFDEAPDSWLFSTYNEGDVAQKKLQKEFTSQIECQVGMATASAHFRMFPDKVRSVVVRVPLNDCLNIANENLNKTSSSVENLATLAQLKIPNESFKFLFDTAIRTLILFSPKGGDVVPGPYTYRRFWFRDAAFMLHSLLCLGDIERVEKALDQFSFRQQRDGYFRSQEGEWDSNGQVLWIFQRFIELTNLPLKDEWLKSIKKGAKWILHKRAAKTNNEQSPRYGLMPAGFSAEHLGPNDHYYWDNFWSVAGLEAAVALLAKPNDNSVPYLSQKIQEYKYCIDKSVSAQTHTHPHLGIPAAPGRRMDAGAIGSIVASYPLQLYPPNEQVVLATVDFLTNYCFQNNGFFQDMIHSGINPYLTLHVAQVLLRANDASFYHYVERVAELATSTGQWPEAIHPQTGGGCMGDGHHAWAAAEWVMMIRNMFIREEENKLILCSGIPTEWLVSSQTLSFGPTFTKFGQISVTIECAEDHIRCFWDSQKALTNEFFELRLVNYVRNFNSKDTSEISIKRQDLI